jgi:hypothetical protein
MVVQMLVAFNVCWRIFMLVGLCLLVVVPLPKGERRGAISGFVPEIQVVPTDVVTRRRVVGCAAAASALGTVARSGLRTSVDLRCPQGCHLPRELLETLQKLGCVVGRAGRCSL